jgi:myo-inositol-1-phosphate synthase
MAHALHKIVEAVGVLRREILMSQKGVHIEPADGKLGVLLVGLGAVSTTFIAGVEAVKRGLGKPVGSLTQMGTIRLGKRTENRVPRIQDFVPLAKLEDLVFGAWDIFPDDAYAAAAEANVLEKSLLDQLRPDLEAIRPMKGVFDPRYVKRLHGTYVKEGSKWELARQLIAEIETFQRERGVDRSVMVWCGSTEIFMDASEVHESLDAFEEGLKQSSDEISSSMIYAYAALSLGIPFANGAPNLTIDVPALRELAARKRVPICGKDFKTGQTLMKTILAPGLKARMLGLQGWFSTNILGNRDGEVLDDPDNFKTKEVSKLSVLEHILQPHLYPDLYEGFHHQVRINYYPPRGDNKEGWDALDIFGWLGYPMQIKIDFMCRDSILAAPLVLDLALFLDLARRAGMHGIQEWLSFYFKSPMTLPELYPEHDLFIQGMKLKNTLRFLMGEEQITHLGLNYYEAD